MYISKDLCSVCAAFNFIRRLVRRDWCRTHERTKKKKQTHIYIYICMILLYVCVHICFIYVYTHICITYYSHYPSTDNANEQVQICFPVNYGMNATSPKTSVQILPTEPQLLFVVVCVVGVWVGICVFVVLLLPLRMPRTEERRQLS